MNQILPAAIDEDLVRLNRRSDPVLEEVAAQGQSAGLPIVPAETGALLQLLARAVAARRILEIGTANGYSGIWLARALAPDGMLITMEIDTERAAGARANFVRAGLSDRVSVMIGEASRLVSKVAGPFDLIFQDADKFLYEPMLDRLVTLLRPGGLLVTDNALWGGEVVQGYVAHPRREHGSAEAIDQYNRRLAADERLTTVFVACGDGVAIAIRN